MLSRNDSFGAAKENERLSHIPYYGRYVPSKKMMAEVRYIQRWLTLPGDLALQELSDFLKKSSKKEIANLLKDLETEIGIRFKKYILSYLYWEYILWNKELSGLLEKLYNEWKTILYHCMYCMEKEAIKKCPMINSEFALICQHHCTAKKIWTIPIKGIKRKFEIYFCMFRRENDCKNPAW